MAWHRGRVWSPPPVGVGVGPIAAEPNHLPLTVEVEDRLFLVDAGLGDALYEPIPLEAGSYTQGPYTFRLEPTVFESGTSGWSFGHDRAADSFHGMVFEERIASLPDFVARHEWMETNPKSNFVKKFDVFRRDASGVDALRGCVLKRKSAAGITERELTEPREWFEVLADVFGLRLPGVAPEDRQQLWKRVLTKHQEWTVTR